jgi:histidine triad (HIT) family protein
VERFEDVPADLALHLFRVTTQLVPVVKRVSLAEGINIVVNSGSAAGQDEPHFHIHVIPRCAGDGFDVPLPFAGSSMPDRTVLDATAVRIMTALRNPLGALVHGPLEEPASAG